MRFKIDENLHPEVADLLRMCGHDALTVWDENLNGASDPEMVSVCSSEGRVLITFDRGFSDIRAYPPESHSGIIVLRLGSQDRAHVRAVVERLSSMFAAQEPAGQLWVVDEVGVRVRGRTEHS